MPTVIDKQKQNMVNTNLFLSIILGSSLVGIATSYYLAKQVLSAKTGSDEMNEITVGKEAEAITIRLMPDGRVWLRKTGGEGMEVPVDDVAQFSDWLQKYYTDNF